MSEFYPVRTVVDLDHLDEDEIVAGYKAGLHGAQEPGSDKSRAYWHGWRNGRVDGNHDQIDSAQVELARHMVGVYRGLN
jgi:hypothetical protein